MAEIDIFTINLVFKTTCKYSFLKKYPGNFSLFSLQGWVYKTPFGKHFETFINLPAHKKFYNPNVSKLGTHS